MGSGTPEVHLIEINRDGAIAEAVPLCGMAEAGCEATADLYRRVGFRKPWIGYLAEEDGRIVGMCGFKSPPLAGRVEIAYATIPDNEGRGVATQMARHLIRLARTADPGVGVFAQTLPEKNASTSILQKLGFKYTATVQHPEDGEVWEWSLLYDS